LIKSLKGNLVQLSAGKIAVEAILANELLMNRMEGDEQQKSKKRNL
jgi:hypothetical protein